MALKQTKTYTAYEKVIGGASSLLVDLFCQLGNLTLTLQREQQSKEVRLVRLAESTNDAGKAASPVFERALKTGIILMQFSLLEAIANALAQIAIKTNEKIDGAPRTRCTLSQVEVDLLAEQRSYFDPMTGSLKLNEPAYVPIIDKLAITPVLFGKLYCQEFRLDKRATGWQKIKRLKECRDRLVHFDISAKAGPEPLVPSLDQVKPAYLIQNTDIFEGSEGIRWYLRQLIEMLEKISKDKHGQLINILFAAEYTNWMVLLNFYRSCGISETVFRRDSPPPVGSRINVVSPAVEEEKT